MSGRATRKVPSRIFAGDSNYSEKCVRRRRWGGAEGDLQAWLPLCSRRPPPGRQQDAEEPDEDHSPVAAVWPRARDGLL